MTARPDRGPILDGLAEHGWPAPVRLDPESVDAVARRVVELLGQPADRPSGRLLTTAEKAAELGRSVDWVRDHRRELGAIESAGARPRLYFPPGLPASGGGGGNGSQPADRAADAGPLGAPRRGVRRPGSRSGPARPPITARGVGRRAA